MTRQQRIPDELVQEILRYRLCITPLCQFLQRSLDWPQEGPYRPPDPDFAAYPADCQLLLVSKQWNAAGTPLMYETIVLRSMTQVHRLTVTLKAKPVYGAAVRHVRLTTSPTRPIACESDEIIDIAPISCRTSSAATVSARIRDSANDKSSGIDLSR